MKRWIYSLAVAAALFCAPAAQAANSTVSAMTAASALGGSELLYAVQGGADRKATPLQMAAYVYGLMNGHCTASGTGAITCRLGSASQTGFVQADGSTILASSGVLSVQLSCGLSSDSSGLNTKITPRNNTLTTDAVANTDACSVVTENNASPVAVSIAQAGTTGFASGTPFTLKNLGAGLVTLTPTTSTIDGAASLTLKQNQSVDFYSNGSNYITLPGRPTNVACGDLTNAGGLCSVAPGTGVATAAAANLSAAGGLSSTIASGTSALGTGAITSGACASAVTTPATNTATTDVVWWGFNGDPTAVTGYSPATAGMLTIIAYPTANNVNFKVCNNTASSVTPGAITLNWRIVR